MSKKKATSSSVKDSTTSSSSTSSSTPNVPDWLLKPAQTIAGNVQGILGQGPAAFAPETSGLQKQAWDTASGMQVTPQYQVARGILGGMGDITGGGDVSAERVKGESLLDNLSAYENPYKEQVLNPVLNDYDYKSGLTRAQQAAEGARGGAFGGSRYGIREAQTEEGLARGRASAEGQLLSDMFTQSTGLSGQDAGRRQEASVANQAAALQAAGMNQANALAVARANSEQALARAGQYQSLKDAEMANTRSNLQLQDALGGEATTQGNTARQYPILFNQQAGGLLQGLNPSDYIGKTVTGQETGTEHATGSSKETQQGSLLDSLGQAAQIAMLVASDARLKTDVKTVGHDAKGRRWVSFAYLWAPWKRFFGVIAQEVMKSDPQAVVVGPGGLLLVNYAELR